MKKMLRSLKPAIYFVLILLASGCKKSLNDGIEINVNTNIYKSPVLVRFVNANYTSTNKPGSFSVTITGKDSAQVVMQSGGTNYQATSGLLPLALLQQATPASPVNFTIQANITGFAPITQAVTLTSDTAVVQVVNLIEYANPPTGSVVYNSTNTLNAGVAAGIKLTIPTTNSVTEQAAITIPAGTQMLDGSKNAIDASSVTSTVIHYGTENQFAQRYFPGGLSPKNVISPGGTVIADGITFMPAGLLSINMQAGSTAVKFFSQPIQVSMGVQTTLTNPVTGKAVKAGDTLSIWSMDESSGQWKYESTALIVAGAGGALTANFQASHLSVWSTEWLVFPNSLYGTAINWEGVSAVQTVNKPFVVNLHVNDPNNFAPSSWTGNTLIYFGTVNPYQNYQWIIGISDPDTVTGKISGAVYVRDGRTVIFPSRPAFLDSVMLVCKTFTPDADYNYATLGVTGVNLSKTDTADLYIDPGVLFPNETAQPPLTVLVDSIVTKCTDKDVESNFNGWLTITQPDYPSYQDLAYFTGSNLYLAPSLQQTGGVYDIQISTIYGGNTYTVNDVVLDPSKTQTTYTGDDGNGHTIDAVVKYNSSGANANTFVISVTVHIDCN